MPLTPLLDAIESAVHHHRREQLRELRSTIGRRRVRRFHRPRDERGHFLPNRVLWSRRIDPRPQPERAPGEEPTAPLFEPNVRLNDGQTRWVEWHVPEPEPLPWRAGEARKEAHATRTA